MGGSSSTTSTRARLPACDGGGRLVLTAPSPGDRLARRQHDAEGRALGPARCTRRSARRSVVTMPWQIDSPSPVPRPTGLVVKNGSKMRGSTSGVIPAPLSCTSSTACRSPSRGPQLDADLVLLRARLGHRLRRVEQEVHDHLLEPRLVAPTRGAPSRTTSRRARGGGSRCPPCGWPTARPSPGRPDGACRHRRARSCAARARWSKRARPPGAPRRASP